VWLHAGDGEEEQLRRQAIEAATKGMSVFVRGKARRRLEDRTAPPRELVVMVQDERVELSRDGDTMSLPLGAEPVTREKNGQSGALSAHFDDERMVVSSEGKKGKRVTTYALSPDGTRLTLSVRLTAERLSGPLVYQSTYRRKSPSDASAASSP
jgi:hypothetical protein